jgi:hypothetical protein
VTISVTFAKDTSTHAFFCASILKHMQIQRKGCWLQPQLLQGGKGSSAPMYLVYSKDMLSPSPPRRNRLLSQAASFGSRLPPSSPAPCPAAPPHALGASTPLFCFGSMDESKPNVGHRAYFRGGKTSSARMRLVFSTDILAVAASPRPRALSRRILQLPRLLLRPFAAPPAPDTCSPHCHCVSQ